MFFKARTPLQLWIRLCKFFINSRELINHLPDILGNISDEQLTMIDSLISVGYVNQPSTCSPDSTGGVADYIFNNTFWIERFDWKKILNKSGAYQAIYHHVLNYKQSKQALLWHKYVDIEKLEALKKSYGSYKNKRRFCIGMTFKSSPARSGGCLSSIAILKNQKKDDGTHVFVQTRVQELPMKFFADIVFFAELLKFIGVNEPVKFTIQNISTFFWMITMPYLLSMFSVKKYWKDSKYRRKLIMDILRHDYLASDEYKYRSQARVWKHLNMIWKKEWTEWAESEKKNYKYKIEI